MDKSKNIDIVTDPDVIVIDDTLDVVDDVVSTKVFNRDAIRAAILDAKSEDEVINVFGIQIEIRAPDLEGLLQYKDSANDEHIMARSIVNTCFVPGTNEPVFEDADIEALMKQKFSKDMRKLIKHINACMGGDEEVSKKVETQAFRTT